MRKHIYLPAPTFTKYVCYPESLGRYNRFPQHAEKREPGLATYNLHLILSGSGYAVKDGHESKLAAGTGFLYPKGSFQQYGTYPDDPWDVRWIHFDTAVPLPMLRHVDESSGWFFSFTEADRLIDLTEQMYRLSDPFQTRNEARLSALLYEILAELLQNSQRSEGSLPMKQRNSIRVVADQIRHRCAEPWTLEAMSDLSGYSPYHFLRLFQEVIGKTPNHYLTESRIVAAKRLLVSTGLTIGQVALQSGFSQSSYFIKVFKQSEGLSPKEYRDTYGHF